MRKLKFPVLIKRSEGFQLEEVEDPKKVSEEAVLVGAFSEPEEDFSVIPSPTLLVNYHFGDYERDFLERLAVLEKRRFERYSTRSYRVSVPGRVLVVSQDEERLRSFFETYSSVLEVVPVLLKGTSRDFVSAESFEVEGNEEGYEVVLRVPSPVDPERCFKCGECGRACPEELIGPSPTIDMFRCTFCGKCKEVCPTEAIDLHRKEEVRVSVSFLVSLDGKRWNIPEDVEVFFEDDLKELFSRIGEFYVEEVVAFDGSLCQYSGRLGVGCSACVKECKRRAIRLEDSVKVDHLSCVSCGSCIAVCPTGALQFSGLNDHTFFEYFEGLNLKRDATVVICKEEVLKEFWWKTGRKFKNTFFFEYSVPGALSATHLLSLWALGAGRVVIVAPEEAEGLKKEVEFANEVAEKFYGKKPFSVLSREEFLEAKEFREKNPLPSRFSFGPVTSRRVVLSSVLEHLFYLTEREFSVKREGFGTVEVDEGLCTLCGACLNECRVRALEGDEESITLSFKASWCVGCGICSEVCPEGALRLKNELKVNSKSFSRLKLASDEPVRCPRCGKAFGTKRSHERVRELLKSSGRFKDAEDLLDYCENCKVVVMLERGRFL